MMNENTVRKSYSLRRALVLSATHASMLALGFTAGIYILPILTAPSGPDANALRATTSETLYTGTFTLNLEGSDFLHWGEGEVRILRNKIAHIGRLAPGPDYKLYLTPEFVTDEASFLAVKSRSRRVGDIRSFDGFIVDVPPEVNASEYTTVVVWCEAFSQFITAAKYR